MPSAALNASLTFPLPFLPQPVPGGRRGGSGQGRGTSPAPGSFARSFTPVRRCWQKPVEPRQSLTAMSHDAMACGHVALKETPLEKGAKQQSHLIKL